MTEQVLLEMKGITKSFPGVKALDNMHMTLRRGEVLALLGENGAGKSTLLKVLSGVHIPDDGEIIIKGKKQSFKNPLDAFYAGISIIYQELNYYDELTVAENIFVGNLPKNGAGLIKWNLLNEKTEAVMTRLGINIDPKAFMKHLSTAEKQMVEIAKAIAKEHVEILVMDEPSAALNEEEVSHLLAITKQLAESGIGIVYISHRLEELFEVSDNVQVIRDGQYIDMYKTSGTDANELVKAMVGREISDMYPKQDIPVGETILEVEGLSSKKIEDVSFDVKSGEILGIFGLMGSGRTELCEALFGVDKSATGTVKVHGKEVTIKSPKDAINAGLAYVPSERKREGLILIQSVKQNFSTSILSKLSKLGIINGPKEEINAYKWVDKLGVKTSELGTVIETLSGGNQQKVVLGKWLETNPNVIILNEPTRGIDVGAKVEIYKVMEELCEQGMGVIFISSEQPELLGLSDRVAVMCEGRMVGMINREECCSEDLLHYAIGGSC